MNPVLRMLSVFMLVFVLTSNLAFGLKSKTENKVKLIDDLRTTSVLRAVDGSYAKSSKIQRYNYNVNYGPMSGTAEEMARTYLALEANRYGLANEIDDLELLNIYKSPAGQHVRFRPVVNRIPVFASDITVTINNEKKISFVASAYRSNIRPNTTRAAISAQRAIQIAADYLNIQGKLIDDPKAELMIFDSKTRGAVLAYRTSTVCMDPLGDWEIFVDAVSGQVINVRDRAMYNQKADGGGVTWDPDPLTTAHVVYGGQYVDNNDQDVQVLNDERVPVVLRDISYTGSVYKLEGPYCNLSDLESPSDNFPEPADPNGFNFTRAQQNFEDVMVYYHIDKSYRWLDSLGFDIPGLYQFKADPHGLNGADNSHYVPSSNYCAWGEGGVDDSEDADVIWHEYAHAIQENAAGGMSYSGETQSLQEGCSDYWAVSYSREVDDFDWYKVFTWDGHNPFWPGRLANLEWIYPEDYVSGHNGGQLWSSALMKIWEDIGREVTDRLFIQAHYIWGYSPSLPDAAAAFIQADRDLYNGAHLTSIVYWFDQRGLVNAEDYIPQINHTPLSDTENLNGPYEVPVEIIPGTAPLDPSQMHIVYGYGALTDTLSLQESGIPDLYITFMPGPGVPSQVQYYISVVDSADNYVVNPSGAPSNFFSFYAGQDTISPQITHAPLNDQAYIRWPSTVRAQVTDNMGIAEVQVLYYVNDTANNGMFILSDNGAGNFSGSFDIDSNSVAIGDSIYYRITASDISVNGNIANDPIAGFHSFEIIETKGLVLIINDDIAKSNKISDPDKGSYQRTKTTLGGAADNMARWLNSLGYMADVVSVTTAMSLNWEDYSIVIHSSGGNEDPLSDAAYRSMWETYAAVAGNKYIIEGGEVGYDAASSPGYPTFAANVLHSDDWDGDESGDMNLRAPYSNHPVATNPNQLPASMSLNYEGWGDQDSQKNMVDSYVVYGTTDEPDNAGVLVYDDNPNPLSAQMAYFAFNFAVLTDSVAAQNLIENTVEFLLTDESAPVGSISGMINLSDTTNNSGAKVLLSGVSMDSLMTDSTGAYEFTELYNGEYSISVRKEGYFPDPAVTDGIIVDDNAISGIDFTLDPVVNGQISGTVTLVNAATYDSVDVAIMSQGLMTMTAQDGSYNIDDVIPGQLSVSFAKEGYIPVVVDTMLQNGDSLVIDLTMNKDLAAPSGLSAVSGLDGVVPLNWLPPGTLNEGFEDGIPADWNILNLGDNTSEEGWALTNTNVHSGAQAVECFDGAIDEFMNEWLITNKVSITAANPILNFWHLATSVSYDNAPNYIKVSSLSNSDTSTFETVKVFPVGSLPTVWTLEFVDLSAYIGQSVYIAFQYTSTWGEFWYIDDVALNSATKQISDNRIEIIEPDKFAQHEPDPKLIQHNYQSAFGKQNKNLESYHVFRSEMPDVQVIPDNLVGTTVDTVFSFDDSTVVNQATYYYVISGFYGADGYSPPSNEVSATPEGLVPPANVQIMDSTNYISISWNDVLKKFRVFNKKDHSKNHEIDPANLKGADWFNVYRSMDGSAFYLLQDSVIATAYNDFSVEIGTTYWYYIMSVVNGDESDASAIVSATVVAGNSIMEMTYDDGDPDSGYYWDVAGTGSGNRITPPMEVQIMKAKFYLLAPNAGTNTFTAKIFDYDMVNDVPGTELAAVPVNNAPDNSWVEVDFSSFNISTDHDFIVFMEYDDSNQPVFGFDAEDNGRAWDYDQDAGGWAPWNETYFMRATVGIFTGIEKELSAVPEKYELDQNFPNPFNPVTTINYQLPKTSQVKIEIYNMIGQKIRTLVDAQKEARYYSVVWNGLTDNGSKAASGVYLYRIEAGSFIKIRKMLLLK